MRCFGFKRKWLSLLKPSVAFRYPYCGLSKCVLAPAQFSSLILYLFLMLLTSATGLMSILESLLFFPTFSPMTLTFWKIQVSCLIECHPCQIKLNILCMSCFCTALELRIVFIFLEGCKKEKEEKEGKGGGGGGRRIL